MKFPFGKRRRYPIRRDRSGRSLRQQAFELFDGGMRPSEIYKQKLVKASPRTLFRYFEDWKKENNRPSYSVLKRSMQRDPGVTEELVGELSEQLGMPIGEVVALTNQPWGLLQLFGEHLFGNPPEIVEELVTDIMLLKDRSSLWIRKERGVIYVTTRYRNGQIAQKRLNCNVAGLER